MSGNDEARAREAEARERWGDTEAWRESQRRTGSYSPEQWEAIKAELDGIESRMAEVMRSGGAPDSREAVAVAEEARLHIHRWYYPCSHAMHAGLAEMYTADPRFRAHYEDRAEGLAAFLAEAIRANAAQANDV